MTSIEHGPAEPQKEQAENEFEVLNEKGEPVEKDKNKEKHKHKRLFVFAFFTADGENGVHEDLLEDATIEEALKHGRELWPDANEFKVSTEQLGDPYSYLFAKNGFESMKRRIAFPEETPTLEEFETTQRHLKELNQ